MKHQCTNCGHIDEVRGSQRWEPLSPGLILTLYKFRDAVRRKGVNDVHLESEADLTHQEHANFQKLRYHALVAKVEPGQKSGRWLLTHRAGLFMRGADDRGERFSLPKKVLVEDNHVAGYSEERVHISDFYNRYPHFEKKFEYLITEDNRLVDEAQRQAHLFNVKPSQRVPRYLIN